MSLFVMESKVVTEILLYKNPYTDERGLYDIKKITEHSWKSVSIALIATTLNSFLKEHALTVHIICSQSAHHTRITVRLIVE